VRFPRPKTGVAVATQIAVEGWLRKKGSRSVLGKKPWNRRYFVLYANSSEIRYYGDCAESLFGNLPLDERGSIPLEFVTKIVVPEHDAARGGKRFDLITSKIGDHPYPRDAQVGLRNVPGLAYTLEIAPCDGNARLLRSRVIHHLCAPSGWLCQLQISCVMSISAAGSWAGHDRNRRRRAAGALLQFRGAHGVGAAGVGARASGAHGARRCQLRELANAFSRNAGA
jgi:hypothetical protein